MSYYLMITTSIKNCNPLRVQTSNWIEIFINLNYVKKNYPFTLLSMGIIVCRILF